MSDSSFGSLLIVVLLALAGLVVVLLIRPSKFLRSVQNPLQPDTPRNRVYIRSLGIFFGLFLLTMLTGSTRSLEGFHRNIWFTLLISPVLTAVFLWFLWRYSALQRVNRRFLSGEPEEPQWERRMSVAFCAMLALIVVIAFILGMKGIYPR